MQEKIPKSEKQWVTISDGECITHIITSSWPLRDRYFLYEVLPDGCLKKLGSNKSPAALEEKFLKKEQA